MSPTRSSLPSSPLPVAIAGWVALRRALGGFGLSPAAHGASGWLDELAPFVVVLLLLLAYLWWARRATARQDQEEASHKTEVTHDGQP